MAVCRIEKTKDYIVKRLAYICKDDIDSVNGAIKEPENTEYMHRQRVRNDRGQLTTTEYSILGQPKSLDTSKFPPK